MQMGAGDPASSIGLAVKPERSRIELNDRRVAPALGGVHNGFDALIEAQHTRGKVVPIPPHGVARAEADARGLAAGVDRD